MASFLEELEKIEPLSAAPRAPRKPSFLEELEAINPTPAAPRARTFLEELETIEPAPPAQPDPTAVRRAVVDGVASAVAAGNPLVPAFITRALLTRGGKVGDIVAEVVPSLAGAALGTPGGLAGIAAGGAAGASVGNVLKQAREMARGDRATLGTGELAVAAATGAIPMPGMKAGATALGTTARIAGGRAAQGGLISGAGETARQVIDGEEINVGNIGLSAGMGAGAGLLFGGIEGALAGRRLVAVMTPEGPRIADAEKLPGALQAALDDGPTPLQRRIEQMVAVPPVPENPAAVVDARLARVADVEAALATAQGSSTPTTAATEIVSNANQPPSVKVGDSVMWGNAFTSPTEAQVVQVDPLKIKLSEGSGKGRIIEVSAGESVAAFDEAGRALPTVLFPVAGAASGGALGYAAGDTPEERARYALLGAGAGAGAGALAGRALAPRLPQPGAVAPPRPPVSGPPIPPGPGIPPSPTAKPLGLVESLKASPEIVPPLRMAVAGFYEPLANAESVAAAQARVAGAANLDAAKATYLGNRTPDAVTNAEGLELIRQFQSTGRLADAADVIYDLAQRAKQQGQAIQVLATLSRSTPEGMAAYAQKLLGRKLTPEEAAEIAAGMVGVNRATAPEVKLARAAALLDNLQSRTPAPLDQKLGALTNLSMLLNPKTIVRNVAGNILQASNLTADAIAPVFDYGVSLVRKGAGRVAGKDLGGDRTVSGMAMGEYLAGLAQPARDYALGYAQAQSEGAGRWGSFKEGVATMHHLARLTSGGTLQISDINQGYRTVFSSRFMRMWERTLSTTLGVPDRAFYSAKLRQSLATQQRAAGAAVPTADMLERAGFEAARAIYQDDNFASRSLGEIRKALNSGSTAGISDRFGAGQAVLPFTQVPGSLFLRGLESTPLGFVKAGYEALAPALTRRAFNQREFVQAFSTALTGTVALGSTGYLLARLGVITGAPDEDKDVEALRRQMGLGAYRINVSELKRRMLSMDWSAPRPAEEGDVIVSYDWAQPIAFPVAVGADLWQGERDAEQARKLGRVAPKRAGQVLTALQSAGKTMAEQPLLTGLAGFFKQDNPVDSLAGAAASLPGMLVPTAARQLQALRDNTVYETRGTDVMETAYQRLAAGIPGGAEALGYKPRYDTLGRIAERYQANGNTFFNVLINPAMTSRVTSDPQLRELYRIWSQSGETKQLPRVVDNRITITLGPRQTQQVILTAPEVSDYQQLVGRLTRDTFTRLMSSPGYAKATDEQRAKTLATALSGANEAAKIVLFGHRPASVGTFTRALLAPAKQMRPAAGN